MASVLILALLALPAMAAVQTYVQIRLGSTWRCVRMLYAAAAVYAVLVGALITQAAMGGAFVSPLLHGIGVASTALALLFTLWNARIMTANVELEAEIQAKVKAFMDDWHPGDR